MLCCGWLWQVLRTMERVREAGVDVMTFGQYMRPTRKHMPVSHYVTPEAFDKWRELGEEMVSLEPGFQQYHDVQYRSGPDLCSSGREGVYEVYYVF